MSMVNWRHRMKTNPELEEQPDHGHYPACSGRLQDITNYCNRLLYSTIIIGGMLFMVTMLGIRLRVISWIPSLFGEPDGLLPYFLRLVFCIGLIVLAALGCGRFKICNVVLLVIYTVMTVVPVIDCEGIFDVMIAILGAVGMYRSAKAYSYYKDYNQLIETEGFPHFNQRYIEQVENGKHRAEHPMSYDQYKTPVPEPLKEPNYQRNNVSAPEVPYEPKFTGNSAGYGEMPELTFGGSSTVSAPTGRFTPKDIKAGTISDSGMKLKYKGGS